MLYEIRDYHYRRDLWEQYRKWASDEAIPFLKANLDVVGFWLDAGPDPEIRGREPIESPHGSANVTWIIRWPDKETRDRELAKVLTSPGFSAIWSHHPDPNGYLQTSARFMNGA